MNRLTVFLTSTLLLQSGIMADQATAMKSASAGCHNMETKTVGPSIKDIAAKHRGGNVDELVAIVKKGKAASRSGGMGEHLD